MVEVNVENPLSMKRHSVILVLIVLFVSGMQIACHQPSRRELQNEVVLPNAELLNCRFGECAQMWSTVDAKPGAITPWRVTIERLGNDPCPNGIIALYDKNISMEELIDAVTERYGIGVSKKRFARGDMESCQQEFGDKFVPAS